MSPQPLITPLRVLSISLGSKDASGKQIGFTLSPVKSNAESNFRITRSKSNTLMLPLYQDIRNYQNMYKSTYSCVHISSDSLFSKILKKPSIAQKKMTPHMKTKVLVIGKKKHAKDIGVSQLIWL